MTTTYLPARIPVGASGFPTVSANQIRTFGLGEFPLSGVENPRGCPRKYHHRYELGKKDTRPSYALLYGRVFHRALELMESEQLNPEEALAKAWDPELGPDAYEEALDDMRAWMERGDTPLDRYATLATEIDLSALLYVDEVYGPIYLRGIIDRVAVDFDDPNLVHVSDWKSNRQPPSIDEVRKDLQAIIYSWLVLQCWEELGLSRKPTVVFHLDAIKWRELPPVHFSESDIEAWLSWMIALVRTILRDTEHKPVLNPGCAHCFVADSCPEYRSLPDLAASLMQVRPAEPEVWELVPWSLDVQAERLQAYRDDIVAWRDKANAMRLLLEKAVKVVDEQFKGDARLLGSVSAGGSTWEVTTKWEKEPDLRRLHRVLGERFYEVITTSKAKLERITKGWPPSEAKEVLDCIRSVPAGTTVAKSKG